MQSTKLFSIFWYVLAGLVLLGVIALSGIFIVQCNNASRQAALTTNSAKAHVQDMIREKANLYLGLIDIFQSDEKLIAAYRQRDRELFYSLAEPLSEHMQEKFGLTHFYVHQPDRMNFIRMHNPEKHSDKINRQTLLGAQKSQQDFSGIEFGIHHNLTLRVVRPWRVDGELIGYLELGEEIGHMFPRISKEINAQLLLSIKKELIDESLFKEEWLEKFDPERKLIKTEHYIVINAVEKISNQIQSHIESGTIGRHYALKADGSRYSMMSVPLEDVQKQQVGLITILINMDEQHAYMMRLIWSVGLVGMLVSAGILVLLYLFLKKIDRRIKEGYQKIYELSIRDSMTGLYNKRHFSVLAPSLIRQAKRMKKDIALTMIDIDHFKLFNDTYGHARGDEVIKEVAKVMEAHYRRETDYLFRVGGEEFAVICLDTGRKDALDIANKLRQGVSDRNMAHCNNCQYGIVTISSGVIVHHADELAVEIDVLYKYADAALYLAKEQGRNRVEYADFEKHLGGDGI